MLEDQFQRLLFFDTEGTVRCKLKHVSGVEVQAYGKSAAKAFSKAMQRLLEKLEER